MLLESLSGNVSSTLWRVRGRLVSWANSSVGTQSCSTPPRHAAVRPDPTRPWYVRVLDSTSKFSASRPPSNHGLPWKNFNIKFLPKQAMVEQNLCAIFEYVSQIVYSTKWLPNCLGLKLFLISADCNGTEAIPDIPCMKNIYKDNLLSVHWSAAQNKERFSSRGETADQPLVLFSSIGLKKL